MERGGKNMQVMQEKLTQIVISAQKLKVMHAKKNSNHASQANGEGKSICFYLWLITQFYLKELKTDLFLVQLNIKVAE